MSVRALIRLGPDPAAGAEISHTVPLSPTGIEVWGVVAMRFVLVTDGTAIDREVTVEFGNGSNIILSTGPNVVQTASQTVVYNVAAFGLSGLVAPLQLAVPIPPGLLLKPGDFIRTVTSNLQAGDNFSAPVFSVLSPLVHADQLPA